jgi:hypothetical protein
MNISAQIAKHLKEVYFGGNWTDVNLKETVEGISWQQATTQVFSLNTIAALVFHMDYYIVAVLEVLQGRPLSASDKFSFDLPKINSEEDWKNLLDTAYTNARKIASLIEVFPEDQLEKTFSNDKYGNFHRNLLGIIEHCHYHLGQIVLIKKILSQSPGI